MKNLMLLSMIALSSQAMAYDYYNCSYDVEITNVKLNNDLDRLLPLSKKSELYFVYRTEQLERYSNRDSSVGHYEAFHIQDEDLGRNLNPALPKLEFDSTSIGVERIYIAVTEWERDRGTLNHDVSGYGVVLNTYINIGHFQDWVPKDILDSTYFYDYKSYTKRTRDLEVKLHVNRKCNKTPVRL